MSEQPDFLSLFKPSLLSLILLFRKLWLVNLKIESFQALNASYDFDFDMRMGIGAGIEGMIIPYTASGFAEIWRGPALA